MAAPIFKRPKLNSPKNLPDTPSAAHISLQRNSAVEPALAGEDEATLKAAQMPATFETRKPDLGGGPLQLLKAPQISAERKGGRLNCGSPCRPCRRRRVTSFRAKTAR